MAPQNYVITIGRQLGSGGADLGRELAAALGFHYLDKEILTRAAAKLQIPADNLEWIEEKPFTIWKSLMQTNSYDTSFMLADYYTPTGRTLYEAESQIMRRAVEEESCVVVGRCSNHIFAQHPRRVSVFLHADAEIRLAKVVQRFQLPEEKARKEMEKVDKERASYYNTYTGHKWLDMCQYDLTIDTGKLSTEQLKNMILHYVQTRFPELAL